MRLSEGGRNPLLDGRLHTKYVHVSPRPPTPHEVFLLLPRKNKNKTSEVNASGLVHCNLEILRRGKNGLH